MEKNPGINPTSQEYVDWVNNYIAPNAVDTERSSDIVLEASFDPPLKNDAKIGINLWSNQMKGDRGPFRVHVNHDQPAVLRASLWGIDEGAAHLLSGLVRATMPKTVLETGTNRGRSTKAIASALVENKMGHLYTIDAVDFDVQGKVLTEEESKVTTPILGPFDEEVNFAPLKDLEDIEFAFLDAAHDRDGLIKEMAFVEAHCAKGCLVVVDNADDEGWPDIKKLFENYMDHPSVLIPSLTGMQLIQMR